MARAGAKTTRRKLEVPFNGPQLAAYEAFSPGNTLFTGWGRGVGKTYFKRQLWWLLVAQYDSRQREGCPDQLTGVRINCLCPTLKQWKDINWSGIVSELGPGGKWAWLGAKLDAQRGQVTFRGGSVLRAFPASDYNARTARGMRTDVLDADEIDDIDALVYDGVAVPWLSEPWSLGIELLGGTPTRGRHGLWWRTMQAGKVGKRLRDGEDPRAVLTEDEIDKYSTLVADESAGIEQVVEALKRIHSFHATYRDAPETVTPRAVARAIATTPAQTFRREWEADPDAGEGLVFQFDERFHVRDPSPDVHFAEFVVGMDHGTVDAGVLLRAGVVGHGNDAVLWVLDEYYESGVPNHVWDRRAAEWRGARFYPDNSRADRVQDLRALGLDVGETDRGKGSIAAGIARVADLLHIRTRETVGPAFEPIVSRYARLYVSRRCSNLIREFGLYRWRRRADGTFEDEPEDRNNHAIDALRYLTVGRFGRPESHRHETGR